jgi:hypothetical protein
VRLTSQRSGVTEAEDALLRHVLRELRHANATGQQLLLTIDPWVSGEGAHVFTTYNTMGTSEEFPGRIGKRRRPTRAAELAERSRK